RVRTRPRHLFRPTRATARRCLAVGPRLGDAGASLRCDLSRATAHADADPGLSRSRHRADRPGGAAPRVRQTAGHACAAAGRPPLGPRVAAADGRLAGLRGRAVRTRNGAAPGPYRSVLAVLG